MLIDPDILLVVGLTLMGFAIPSVISAFSDARAPRASALTVMIAGGMILYALKTQPGGYRMADIPEAFVRVFAQVVN